MLRFLLYLPSKFTPPDRSESFRAVFEFGVIRSKISLTVAVRVCVFNRIIV